MKLDDLAVTHHYASTNGIRMHYVERGTGPVVVLLHGFPELWWCWRHNIAPLADAGFRVIAPDLRGYNETEQRGPFDLDTLADDLRGLLDHLGVEQATIVGHDWGGAITWHFSQKHPNRCTRAAVLNCPHPVVMAKTLLRGNLRQLRRSWYMFFFALPRLPERMLLRNNGGEVLRMLRAHANDRKNFSEEELEPHRRALLRPGAATAMLGYYRASIAEAMRSKGGPKKLPPTPVPFLLLWAIDDKALGFDDVVPGTERLAPNLRIERIENCGHFVAAEQPEIVNDRLLAFFREDAS